MNGHRCCGRDIDRYGVWRTMTVHSQLCRADQRQCLPLVNGERRVGSEDFQRWMRAVKGAVDECVSETMSCSMPWARPGDADVSECLSTCILNGGEPDGVDGGDGLIRG